MLGPWEEYVIGVALAFAAGALLCIALSDLLRKFISTAMTAPNSRWRSSRESASPICFTTSNPPAFIDSAVRGLA